MNIIVAMKRLPAIALVGAAACIHKDRANMICRAANAFSFHGYSPTMTRKSQEAGFRGVFMVSKTNDKISGFAEKNSTVALSRIPQHILSDDFEYYSASSSRSSMSSSIKNTTTLELKAPSSSASIELNPIFPSNKDGQQPEFRSFTNKLKPLMNSIGWRFVVVALCALWGSNFAVAKVVMGEPNVESSIYALSRFGVSALALAPFAIGSFTKSFGSNSSSNNNTKEDKSRTIAASAEVVCNKYGCGVDIQQTSTQQKTSIDMDLIKESIICGSWVAFGYIGQTIGLLSASSSKSCVICSMHCVYVAIISEIWRVQQQNQQQDSDSTAKSITSDAQNRYDELLTSFDSTNGPVLSSPENTATFDFKKLIPTVVAVLGVAIIELTGAEGTTGGTNIGDIVSFAQPIGFGTGYLILEKIMSKRPEAALVVSFIKLTVVTFFSLVMFEVTQIISSSALAPLDSGNAMTPVRLHLILSSMQLPNFDPILKSPVATAGILYTGLITTALALWVESIAFAKVPATDASLILTTEPLFAAGLGAVALGESFALPDYIGCSFIVGACVLSIILDYDTSALDDTNNSIVTARASSKASPIDLAP